MIKHLTWVLILFAVIIGNAQTKKFKKLLKSNLKGTVPVLQVANVSNKYILFDARGQKEYNTSHLKNAKFIGFDFFNIEEVLEAYPDKSQPILVYCSIGVRSELIGEKLLTGGYQNVFNLYGGIFEWKNQSKEVVDIKEKPTEQVHTFSKEWSKWLLKGEKVYEN